MDKDIISSAQNPTIKHLRKLLGQGKYRHQQGEVVAEGVHLAAALGQSNYRPKLVIYAQSSLHNQEIIDLVEDFTESGVDSLVVKDSLFESVSDIHATVGLIVVFDRPQLDLAELSETALLLEDVQDPGNLGTILRTATAAGVKRVYLSAGSASAWSPKSLRAGMGAQFGLDIYEDVDLLPLIKGSSLPVLATDLSAEQTIYQTDLGDSAWLFGSEGQGVSPELLAACSQRVTIPQADSTVESLNVAAAVAVCLFEQKRQRDL